MKLRINDNWGIKTDKYQYNLCKIINKKRDGEIVEIFKPVKSTYKTLGDVLEGYYEHKLKTEDNITSLEELKELQKDILDEIKSLNNKIEVDIEVNK